jgi:hypothetical protein
VQTTKKLKLIGDSINKIMSEAINRRLVCSWPFCLERATEETSDALLGSLETEYGCFYLGYLQRFMQIKLGPAGIKVPTEEELSQLSLTCFDVSINLPAGFGYTTDADSVKGPAISVELVKMASEPQRRIGQINVDALASQIRSFESLDLEHSKKVSPHER